MKKILFLLLGIIFITISRSYGEENSTENLILSYKDKVNAKIKLTEEYDRDALRSFKRGNIEKARKIYKKTLELYPGISELYLKLGDVYSQYSDYENAIKAYGKAAEYRPDNDQIYVKLSDLYEKIKYKQRASFYSEEFLEEDPTDDDQ